MHLRALQAFNVVGLHNVIPVHGNVGLVLPLTSIPLEQAESVKDPT